MDRRTQNRTLKTWNEMKALVAALDPLVRAVVIRGTFDSGIRQDPPRSTDDLMVGPGGQFLPGPSYADPTGENAVRAEIADRVSRAVETIASNITIANNFAKWILQGVPETTDEALLRAIPDCEACDRPVFGRVKAGYDLECYERKRTLGIADRSEFRRVRLAELALDEEAAQ